VDIHECPNKVGVPEVDVKDIQIEWSALLGQGKKTSVVPATWQGIEVALQICDNDHDNKYKYGQRELERYCDLKELQGTFIPCLYFFSRQEDGTHMLGLERGERVKDCVSETELDELNDKVIAYGWRQREGPLRPDNTVWMKNDNGTNRLVLVDLESFLPTNEAWHSRLATFTH